MYSIDSLLYIRVDLIAHLLLDIFSVTRGCFVYFICVYYLENVYLIVVGGIHIFFPPRHDNP